MEVILPQGRTQRHALILGCGFTGRRVARLLLERGWAVTATARRPRSLATIERAGGRVLAFDAAENADIGEPADGAHLVLSIPTLRTDEGLCEPTPRLVSSLRGTPRHVTYLSTTGVYGQSRTVDERTPVAPATPRQHLRVAAERAVQALECPSLVLRPAAIYGPGRGVHTRMRAGTFRLSAGRPLTVSRVHVDDLAAIVAASVRQTVEGAFPVADERPATSAEVARFCSELMCVPAPASVPLSRLPETRRADRRVDGRAIRQVTGVRLRYPTYREGIPASLAEEAEADHGCPQ